MYICKYGNDYYKNKEGIIIKYLVDDCFLMFFKIISTNKKQLAVSVRYPMIGRFTLYLEQTTAIINKNGIISFLIGACILILLPTKKIEKTSMLVSKSSLKNQKGPNNNSYFSIFSRLYIIEGYSFKE